MKKIKFLLPLLICSIFAFNLAADHYRNELYEIAIDFEASQANFVEKLIKVNDQQYSYLENEQEGKQGTVLMLHGFSASKENWLRFAAPLADKFHLIALDLKGHGKSVADIQESFSVESQVMFVREFIAANNLKKIHLVGNSMGGAISSLYAATYPDQVKSITLISPAGIHDIPSKLDEMLESGSNPLIAQSAEEFENVMSFVMEDMPYIPSAITKVEAEKAEKRVAVNQKIFSDLRADMHKGLEKHFKNISAPTLIIWGDHDRAINVKNIDKYVAMIPGAEKLVLEDIGHLAMLEAPKVSAQAMLNFLSRRS